MPRTREQNEIIRKKTKERILGSALGLYVKYGYPGTVMERVASEAGLAKGLLYYYYKDKNRMFRDLFDTMIERISAESEKAFAKTEGKDPLARLVGYSAEIFGMGMKDPRSIMFAMRMPFDAYAVFGEEGWEKGMLGSGIHTRNLENIIREGASDGTFCCRDAALSAAAYWTVYVAGLFKFVRMMDGEGSRRGKDEGDVFRQLIAFGMAGLGVDRDKWEVVLEAIMKEKENEDIQK